MSEWSVYPGEEEVSAGVCFGSAQLTRAVSSRRQPCRHVSPGPGGSGHHLWSSLRWELENTNKKNLKKKSTLFFFAPLFFHDFKTRRNSIDYFVRPSVCFSSLCLSVCTSNMYVCPTIRSLNAPIALVFFQISATNMWRLYIFSSSY